MQYPSIWENKIWTVRNAYGQGLSKVYDASLPCRFRLHLDPTSAKPQFTVEAVDGAGSLPSFWTNLVLKPTGSYHLSWFDPDSRLPDWEDIDWRNATDPGKVAYLEKIAAHLTDTRSESNTDVARLSGRKTDGTGEYEFSIFWVPDAIAGDDEVVIICSRHLSEGTSQDGTGHGDKR
jgi:hypothetical protein